MRVRSAYGNHLRYVEEVIGLAESAHNFAAMSLLQLPRHTVFICDPYIHLDPTADEIAEMAVLAAAELRRFGQTPRVALVSHSNFGTANDASARKMRDALALINRRAPDLEVEGDACRCGLSKPLLNRIFPDAQLSAEAILLIMPNVDAANATFNALKIVAGQGISVGPDCSARPSRFTFSRPRRPRGDREHDRTDGGCRRIRRAGRLIELLEGERNMATATPTEAALVPSPGPMVSAPVRPGSRRNPYGRPPGPLLSTVGEVMKPLGDAFIKMIKMLIAPIIFFTVVHGIASMKDMRKVGRVG